MNDVELQFRSCLFTLSNIECIRCPADSSRAKLFVQEHMLIAIMKGQGNGLIDGKRVRLLKGMSFLLLPDTLLEIEGADTSELVYYRLQFRVQRVQEQVVEQAGPAKGEAPVFPLSGMLNIQPFGQWSALLEELLQGQEEAAGLAMYRQHIRFQELIYYICERNGTHSARHSRSAVIDTIAALHEDVALQTTVKQLADKANMGARQYSYLFKELTGKSVVEYVTELRINHAKEQLLVSNERLSTIARNAGFQDVYYFSRRFKQIVGLSPKQFVNERRSALRIVALYYGGILLAMGVKPVGANLTWWGGSAFLEELESEVVDVGTAPSPELIAGLEPDLILMNSNNREEYEQYAKIAPAVLIPYDGNRDIYEETRLVGELINHSAAAEQFIARYEKQAALARAQLAAAGMAAERMAAVIIRLEPGGAGFSVFGENYGRSGWVIYRGLRFSATVQVQEMMVKGMQIQQNLPFNLLHEYAASADYIFLINEGEGIELVAGSALWESLPAVQMGRVLELSRAQFSYLDPISLEAQLELLTAMLLKR
jgi:ABC-type Fe3+-hydroxamate transport system substrate-binding protein